MPALIFFLSLFHPLYFPSFFSNVKKYWIGLRQKKYNVCVGWGGKIWVYLEDEMMWTSGSESLFNQATSLSDTIYWLFLSLLFNKINWQLLKTKRVQMWTYWISIKFRWVSWFPVFINVCFMLQIHLFTLSTWHLCHSPLQPLTGISWGLSQGVFSSSSKFSP